MIKNVISAIFRYGIAYSVGFIAGHNAIGWWPLFIAVLLMFTVDAVFLYFIKSYSFSDHLPYGK